MWVSINFLFTACCIWTRLLGAAGSGVSGAQEGWVRPTLTFLDDDTTTTGGPEGAADALSPSPRATPVSSTLVKVALVSGVVNMIGAALELWHRLRSFQRRTHGRGHDRGRNGDGGRVGGDSSGGGELGSGQSFSYEKALSIASHLKWKLGHHAHHPHHNDQAHRQHHREQHSHKHGRGHGHGHGHHGKDLEAPRRKRRNWSCTRRVYRFLLATKRVWDRSQVGQLTFDNTEPQSQSSPSRTAFAFQIVYRYGRT